MSAAGRTICLRADAGAEIGAGHVMRCLALAQAWQDAGGRVILAAARLPTRLLDRLIREDIAVAAIDGPPGGEADADQTCSLARQSGSTWVVLDGYRFSTEFQRHVRRSGAALMVMDDDGRAGEYDADVILNQNLHACPEMYARRAPDTRLRLGSAYVLLRREYRAVTPAPGDFAGPGRRVLITLGGSDRRNFSAKCLEATEKLTSEGLEVTVLAGPDNAHLEALRRMTEHRPGVRVEYNTPDMPGWLQWADLVVCSAGTTVWECAYLGTPALVGTTSRVEEVLVGGLRRAGLFALCGEFEIATPDMLADEIQRLLDDSVNRRRMSRLGRQTVDGAGAQRVLSMLCQPACVEA